MAKWGEGFGIENERKVNKTRCDSEPKYESFLPNENSSAAMITSLKSPKGRGAFSG